MDDGKTFVQSLSHIQLFVTPWTAARQASLSITISWSLLKLISLVECKAYIYMYKYIYMYIYIYIYMCVCVCVCVYGHTYMSLTYI